MLEEGLWSRERRRRAHRRRRERKAHFGEMVQLDGSFHDWLEGRGPRACLMNLVDDATGATLCRMGEEEMPVIITGLPVVGQLIITASVLPQLEQERAFFR